MVSVKVDLRFGFSFSFKKDCFKVFKSWVRFERLFGG